jgi:hypothetical protein
VGPPSSTSSRKKERKARCMISKRREVRVEWIC